MVPTRTEESPDEQKEFLRTQYNGLPLEEIGDPGRHLLGDPAPEFSYPSTGATPVLGCSCGVWGCWPLLTIITSTPETVTWSSFRQPFRKGWENLPRGLYVFARPAYESSLADPVRLAEDPLRLHEETTR